MTQYNTLNVSLPHLQLKRLKSEIKWYSSNVKLSLNVVGDSNDEANFPHKLLLTNTQLSKIHKAFGNGSSGNINLFKNLAV